MANETSPAEPTAGVSVDDQPIADLTRAPLPTPQTLRRRRSLPMQFSRFLSFNSRIMRMVIKGHHDSE